MFLFLQFMGLPAILHGWQSASQHISTAHGFDLTTLDLIDSPAFSTTLNFHPSWGAVYVYTPHDISMSTRCTCLPIVTYKYDYSVNIYHNTIELHMERSAPALKFVIE